MNYGQVLNQNYSQFSDDEKLNYGLKIALSRLQTELNRAWYQEPKDFTPKGPETIYKNSLPSYNDISNYQLIDPFCKVNNVENTSVITDVTVGDILNNSDKGSGWGFGDINGDKDFYSPSNNIPVRDNDTNITNITSAQTGLSKRMFTRYRYWENGLTGKNSATDGSVIQSGDGTYNNKVEPENAILSYVNGSLSVTRIWKNYNDNLGKGNAEDQFFTKLQTFSSPIKIIDPNNINTNDYTDITKAHPFLELYIQVPTISTRQKADSANTNTSGNTNGSDNIGFFNPIMKKALGDVEGFKYVIRGWTGNIAKWGDLTIETGAVNNTNILYFLNNPGFILCYGVRDIVNGLNLSFKYPPLISFLKYTGESFAEGIIPQGPVSDLPAVEISKNKDLYLSTDEKKIHFLVEETKENGDITKEWREIAGGGGGTITGEEQVNVLKSPNLSFTPLKTVSTISCGYQHSFILLNTGKVMSFGSNSNGQLGLGNQFLNSYASTPTEVNSSSGYNKTNAISVACAMKHSLVLLKNGKVLSVGQNVAGELGIGTKNDQKNELIPIVPANDYSNNAISISCGGYSTAILINTGKVLTCGMNGKGQLGNGDTQDQKNLVNVLASNGYEQNNAVAVSCGYYHMAILLNNGKVLTVGKNNVGQLGDRTYNNSLTLVSVKQNSYGYDLTNAISVSCGTSVYFAHTAILLNSGKVLTFGSNYSGQLGHDAVSQSSEPIDVEGNMQYNQSNAVSVECGSSFTAILLNTGEVLTFGNNSYGQIGNGSGGNLMGPNVDVDSPTQVTTSANYYRDNAVGISCGEDFTFIILNTGKLVSFGNSDKGQLGGGAFITSSSNPISVTNIDGHNNKIAILNTLIKSNNLTVGLIENLIINFDKYQFEENDTLNFEINDLFMKDNFLDEIYQNNINPKSFMDICGNNVNNPPIITIINSNGNVGIGDSEPNETLTLKSEQNVFINVQTNDLGFQSGIEFSSSYDNYSVKNMARIFAQNQVYSHSSGPKNKYTYGEEKSYKDLIFQIANNSSDEGVYIERMRIAGYNGNVGIGTNLPVGAKLTLYEEQGCNLYIQSRDSDASIYINNNPARAAYFAFNSKLIFNDANATSNTEKIVINESGNVGIGTTNPTHSLSVCGATATYGVVVPGIHMGIDASGSANIEICADRNNGKYGAAYIDFKSNEGDTDYNARIIYYNNSNEMRFETRPTGGAVDAHGNVIPKNALTITNGGQIGIGTGAAAVNGASKASLTVYNELWSDLEIRSNSYYARLLLISGNENDYSFITYNQRFSIFKRNVGHQLWIESSGEVNIANNLRLLNHQYIFFGSDNATSIVGGYPSNYLSFRTSSTERIRVNNLGNVGIGTNSPDSLLHLKSSVRPQLKVGHAVEPGYIAIADYYIIGYNISQKFHIYNEYQNLVLGGNHNVEINQNCIVYGSYYLNRAEDQYIQKQNSGDLWLWNGYGNIRFGTHAVANSTFQCNMIQHNYNHLYFRGNQDHWIQKWDGTSETTLNIRNDLGNLNLSSLNGYVQTLSSFFVQYGMRVSGGAYFYSSSYMDAYKYYSNVYLSVNSVKTSLPHSIDAAGYIIATGFGVHSDKRIKEKITEVPDNMALEKLRVIECKYYKYKDKVARGTNKTIGFIAQQVKEQFPIAVSIKKDFIPNEMRIIKNPQWTKISDASNNKFKLTIPDLEDISGNTKYRFFVSNDLSGNDISGNDLSGNDLPNNDISGNKEVVKDIYSLEDDPKSFYFEKRWENIFLYGKEVDDFHTLDKQKLFALNFSATQEIDRIQQKQIIDISLNKIDIEMNQIDIFNTKQKLISLENENSNLKTKVDLLENELSSLKALVQQLIESNSS